MPTDPRNRLERFIASMEMTHEKWHDGIGYDLSEIKVADPTELAAIESFLLSRSVRDWRDVEALATLGTDRAREALRSAHETGSDKVKLAIVTHAPEILEENERTEDLVSALEIATLYGGLSEAIDECAEFHPPEVIDALLRGVRSREGQVAVNFAAMLFYIHGKADEPFDIQHRDFFLRFHTENPEEREVVYQELRRRLLPSPDGEG